MSADVQMTDAAPLKAEGENSQVQGGEGLAQDASGTSAAGEVQLPFWAAVDASEKSQVCPVCGIPTKFDLATLNIEQGGWPWIVFDTIQRLHAERVSEQLMTHNATYSAEEVFAFVQRHYSGSTPEWALAVQETLRSMPFLFPVIDEAAMLYTVRRVDNLEELAIFALSNAPGDGQTADEPKRGTKRRHSEAEGGERGGDDDDDFDEKKPGKEKTVYCFAPNCNKGYTRLDSLRQHLGRFHPGYSVDSKFNMIGPNGLIGTLPRKERRNKSSQVRDGVYPCPAPGCGKYYSSEAVAKAHMKKLHPDVPVPKKIEPVPHEGATPMRGQDALTTELTINQENGAHLSSEEGAGKKARREPPSFPAPKLYPTYSFTTIPTVDFLSALINPPDGVPPSAPQPSYSVPATSPVDWDKLKLLMSSSIAKQGTGS